MYDPNIGRWLNEDPIGFEAGDENLYRYVGNDPVNKIDPSGLLEFDHSVSQPPKLDGKLGVDFVISQKLESDDKMTAADGSQLWQTNEVKTYSFVWDRANQVVVISDDTKLILDVNNIGGKTTPISGITDKIGIKLGNPNEADDVILFVQVVKKRMGLRPFKVNNGAVEFLAPSLPTQPKTTYEASPEQWARANQMQQANPMPLEVTMIYMYLNRECVREAIDVKSEKERIDKMAELFKGIWGGDAPAGELRIEYLKYGNLGEWRYPEAK